ncbi:hypothetical protein [Medusavirus stheno T3]|uniref:Uncharacterized protein n=1 Tax=Medusavirus stheno T3 TaxID=3069717 RepID=A0A7S7YF09_9VIRU|nr:hypothetical protein QKU73_gp099 [Acanthamoeba castellanii medusavirus]QPB44280.1 hypothetical protein [Medusavirus stheno T3]
MNEHISATVERLAADHELPRRAADIIREHALATTIRATGPDNDGLYHISGDAARLLDECYNAQTDKRCSRPTRFIDDFFLDPATRPTAGGNVYHRLASARHFSDRAHACHWIVKNYFLGGLRDRADNGMTPFEVAFECGNYAIAKALMIADHKFDAGGRMDEIIARYDKFLRDIECDCADGDSEEEDDEEEEPPQPRRDAKKRRHDE